MERVTTVSTRLTTAQHERLTRLAEEHPGAKVVGWSETGYGPRVRGASGKTFRVLNPHGRLVKDRP